MKLAKTVTENPTSLNANYRILLSLPFIFSVFLLLINDHILKYQYPGVITGKLSDFAGLFAFPLFFSALIPKQMKRIYFFSVGLFVFWSTGLSQSLIHQLNNLGVMVGRTIDYSDLIALTILPLSFFYFKSYKKPVSNSDNFKWQTITVLIVSLFAFCATTVPQSYLPMNLNTNETFVIELSKQEFMKKIDQDYNSSFQDSTMKVSYFSYDPKIEISASIVVSSLDSNRTQVCLDSLLYMTKPKGLFSKVESPKRLKKALNVDKHERIREFKENFIDKVLKDEYGPYFHNYK